MASETSIVEAQLALKQIRCWKLIEDGLTIGWMPSYPQIMIGEPMSNPPNEVPEAGTDAAHIYWAAQGPAACFAEGWRLSLQHYGTPVGDLRDGPVMKYQRMPDGSLRILSEWSGPNPVRRIK